MPAEEAKYPEGIRLWRDCSRAHFAGVVELLAEADQVELQDLRRGHLVELLAEADQVELQDLRRGDLVELARPLKRGG